MDGRFGAFGKMPALGDFLKLNLPAGFLGIWDAWLQDTLVNARQNMGDDWNSRYMSAPIWRFTLPAGQAGERAMSGVLMPSVDRVGRQFPLTLAAPHEDIPSGWMHFANRGAFEALEDIALSALEDELDRDALSARLAEVSLVTPRPAPVCRREYSGTVPPDAALAAAAIPAEAGVWTTSIPGDHRMLLRPSLPDSRDVQGLIDLDAPLWRRASEAVPT